MDKKRRRSEEMEEDINVKELRESSPVDMDMSRLQINDRERAGVYYDLGYLLDKLESESTREVMEERINDIIESARPLVILYDVDTYYLPKDVDKYIKVFRNLFMNHRRLFKYIFKIDQVLPINSANGKIFIVKTVSKKVESPKLLIKVALNKDVDPISYEYYVGLTLNRLRIDYNVDHFAIMYGRFFCGLNPNVDVITEKQDLEKIELCDGRFGGKTHLLYEFIKDIETDKVVTLSDYINNVKDDLSREISIINVMILVLYALQQAQDKLDFTHYDLHAKNILVVKLLEEREYNIEYNGNKLTIITDVVPHIIDYGRSHINPTRATSEDNVFKDYEKNMELTDFEVYQRMLFKKYTLNRSRERDIKGLKKTEMHLHKLANRYLYKKEIDLSNEEQIEETFETIEFKKGIVEIYYNGQYEIEDNKFRIIKCDFGIDTTIRHKKYDFFRICRIVGGMMLNLSKEKELYSKTIWKNLGDKLELQYPYHDGWYYSLVSDYKPNPIGIMTDDSAFDTPIDVAYYLYNVLYGKDEQYGGCDIRQSKTLSQQGETDEKIEKKKDNLSNKMEAKNEKVGEKSKIDFEKLKRNLEREKEKYDFMKIDYSNMNTGSFNINTDENTGENELNKN